MSGIHFGRIVTKKNIEKEGFSWLNIQDYVEGFIKNCEICLQTLPKTKKNKFVKTISFNQPLERI